MGQNGGGRQLVLLPPNFIRISSQMRPFTRYRWLRDGAPTGETSRKTTVDHKGPTVPHVLRYEKTHSDVMRCSLIRMCGTAIHVLLVGAPPLSKRAGGGLPAAPAAEGQRGGGRDPLQGRSARRSSGSGGMEAARGCQRRKGEEIRGRASRGRRPRANGEARRLIKQGAARINDELVSDQNATISLSDLGENGAVKLSAGKKRHALLRPV